MDIKTPVFELKDMSYNYPDSPPAVKEITLTFAPEESAVIIGANGSGKSTLLKLLDGLYFPASGEIKAFGKPLTEKRLQDETFSCAFRSRVGLLFQNPDVQLFSPTVGDEVAFGPQQLGLSFEEAKARAAEALKALGIERLRKRAPYQLSEGEKKKVALAALFSLNPQVWLLDEPTANLDPRTQGWMIDFLLSLADKGKTIVAATHELKIVRIVSRKAYVLGENHCLLARGLSSDILQNDKLLFDANLISSR